MESREVEERVRAWVAEAVVGLGLCPFAAPVVQGGQLEVRVSDARTGEAALEDALAAAVSLLAEEPDGVTTSLIAYPLCLDDFEAYLDLVAQLEGALDAAGAQGVLQVASFHPAYRFDGTESGDVGNWTNRSPVPLVHLLRESDVAAATEDHPDPAGIPEANVRRLEELGERKLRALWSRFSAVDADD